MNNLISDFANELEIAIAERDKMSVELERVQQERGDARYRAELYKLEILKLQMQLQFINVGGKDVK